MRDRDRQSLKAFMEEERRLYEAEQEERNRPIREAEQQLTDTHRKLHAMEKQQVATKADDDVFVDPKTLTRVDPQTGVSTRFELPQADAERFNVEQARLFIRDHPEFYNSEANIKTVVGYLQRNKIEIVSALTFEKAVARLAEFRLLEERPAPVEVLETIEEVQPVVVERQPEKFVGIDLTTGLERQYTPYEVEKMDSTTYRKVFKITKAQLQLPNRNW
jgi:uncharacterized protein (DUF362 family)